MKSKFLALDWLQHLLAAVLMFKLKFPSSPFYNHQPANKDINNERLGQDARVQVELGSTHRCTT